MIYPNKVKNGGTVGIVSLSKGIMGEPFIQHEVKLVEERLPKVFGLKFKYMDNALKGFDYLAAHPEAKAADLKQAFLDPEVDMVWCAIGGDDTFRTLPYLMNDEFKEIITKNPKPFFGFSDTTNNHLMFYKLGLATYYGPALLNDIAELSSELLPYTKDWLDKFFRGDNNITVEPSPVWYEGRTDFSEDQVGVPRIIREEKHGFEFLYGEGNIEGKLLGGCIESLSEMISHTRYDDQKEIYDKYPIFPTRGEWKDKIVFLETSEEKPTPEKLQTMLSTLAKQGIFGVAKGLIVGKPKDEMYYDEYKTIYIELAKNYNLPTVFNLNFGHAEPRMILPYGRPMRIDFNAKTITLPEGLI